MAFNSTDWEKFGQVRRLVFLGVPVARACRDTKLCRTKYYRMLKIGAKEV